MRASRAFLAGILLVSGLVLGGASTPASAQGYFGVTGGLYEPDEEGTDRTEFYGVRGGYRFSPVLGFEGSLTRLDLADSLEIEDDPFFPEFDLEFDLTNLDLSLQWFPGGGNFVVFGGPGVARLDAEISVVFFGERISESESSTIFTAHAGVGYAWQIGERFFIRPEARVRRYFDDELDESGGEDLEISYKSTDYEAGLTFGWRF